MDDGSSSVQIRIGAKYLDGTLQERRGSKKVDEASYTTLTSCDTPREPRTIEHAELNSIMELFLRISCYDSFQLGPSEASTERGKHCPATFVSLCLLESLCS